VAQERVGQVRGPAEAVEVAGGDMKGQLGGMRSAARLSMGSRAADLLDAVMRRLTISATDNSR
jgi:hypothetical protein